MSLIIARNRLFLRLTLPVPAVYAPHVLSPVLCSLYGYFLVFFFLPAKTPVCPRRSRRNLRSVADGGAAATLGRQHTGGSSAGRNPESPQRAAPGPALRGQQPRRQ